MDNLNIYANKVVKALNDATIVSRMAHWNVRGSNFYEAHQLFGRIYDDLGEHMDGLIETFRAFGYNANFEQFTGPGITMQNYDCHYLGALILDYLLTLSSALALCFNMCEESDGDPRIIGLSNRIQNISDEILSDMYLLQSYLGV